MAEQTIVSLRVLPEFKARLRAAARRQRKSVSQYLRDLVEADLRENEERADGPSLAARQAFERFVGCVDLGGRTPTPEEIDEIVYGER